MMGVWSNINTNTSRATLAFLFCVAVLTIYVISQREGLVYYVPESGFIDRIRHAADSGRPKSFFWQSSKSAFKTNSASSSPSLSASLMSTGRPMSESDRPIRYKVYSKSKEQWVTQNSKSNPMSLPSSNRSTTDTLVHFGIVSKAQLDSVKPMHEVLLDEPVFHNYSVLQNARIQRIRDACANKDLFKNLLYKGRTGKVFFRSENYNFSFCKVPKSGSTFWIKAFAVLKYGLSYAEKVFTKSRISVQITTNQYSTSLNTVIRDQSRTILVSRCPYSRLFSAFIDKSFLQLKVDINYRIRDIYNVNINNTACQTNVTFQEFLDWVISRGKNGITLDRHWAPVTSMCSPCKVNPFILVKQETFSRDVEFSLQQLGVEKAKYEYITKALHDHRAELSVPGIISTLFARAHSPIIMKCSGFEEVAKRTWASLQIQGFIDERIEFPAERFNQYQFSNRSYFTNIVLETIKEFPLNSSQSKAQRQRYLYYAYKSINLETIRGIQELYKLDFEIYGYSKLPPTEYKPPDDRK